MNIEMLSEKSRKTIHFILGCICTVLIIALGIGLMVSCWNIYQSGPRTFSRESIGAALSQPAITILIITTAVSCFIGFVAQMVLPLDKAKTKALRDELTAMKTLSKKVGTPNAAQSKKINFEKALRTVIWIVYGLACVVFAVFPAIYLVNRNHFPGIDPTGEIKTAALIVMPYALLMLGGYFVADLVSKYSALRQSAVYKQMLMEKNLRTAEPSDPDKQEKTTSAAVTFLRLALIAAAVCFVVVGIFNGSANDVLTKAVKICTECIGLG